MMIMSYCETQSTESTTSVHGQYVKICQNITIVIIIIIIIIINYLGPRPARELDDSAATHGPNVSLS